MSGAATPPARPVPKRPFVAGIIFLAAGIGLAVLAWMPIAEDRHLAANGVRTEARAPSIEEHRRRGVSTYYPVFLFRTADGRMLRERSSVSVPSVEPYRSGRPVAVVYDPANPSSVRPADSVGGGVGALSWILAALALTAFGLAAVALFKRRS